MDGLELASPTLALFCARAPSGPNNSHNGPIRRRKRGYILTMDQSNAGSAGIFSRRTNQTQEAW
eukprot:2283336-Pyramimonas_sp.AAC.2